MTGKIIMPIGGRETDLPQALYTLATDMLNDKAGGQRYAVALLAIWWQIETPEGREMRTGNIAGLVNLAAELGLVLPPALEAKARKNPRRNGP